MLDMTYEEFKQKMDNDKEFYNIVSEDIGKNTLKSIYISFVGRYFKEKKQ